MASYSVAKTKDHLSQLIDKALAGEEVVITRRGKPAARIVPAEPVRTRKDVAVATARLRERIEKLPSLNIPVHRFSEWMYEEDED